MGQQILLALEDSEHSQAMFNWVLENELQQGTQVHLLHVVLRADEEQHSYLPHADYFEQALPNEQHKAVLEMLTRRYLSPLAQLGIKPAVHLVHGSLDPQTVGRIICQKAADLQVERCYVASHQQPQSLLGKLVHCRTVAEYCKQHCSVPLTVVSSASQQSSVEGPQIERHEPQIAS